jgi:putative two-component system response regulator
MKTRLGTLPVNGNRARILVADDEPQLRGALVELLQFHGYVVSQAGDGQEAVRQTRSELPDLVLMDVSMPIVNGIEACRTIKGDPATRLIPVVLLTALPESSNRLLGIEAGADDFLPKPFNQHELTARVRSLVRIKTYTDALESAESIIFSLALTIEARDAATEGHCLRLATLATHLGEAVGLERSEISTLEVGGYLHDIGKIGVADAILLKPGPLTSAEFERMKTHTVIGERLCGDLRSLRPVRPIIRHHHERLDGSGYPDGLAGGAVPLLAQIISIADVYDALTTQRPYRPALEPARAYDELWTEARKGWRDHALVDEFIALSTASV